MRDVLYTVSQDMLVYYHPPLNSATATAVQMAAPVPEIMNIPL
jgi:hypothetical protein